jgi:hypothetical protein
MKPGQPEEAAAIAAACADLPAGATVTDDDGSPDGSWSPTSPSSRRTTSPCAAFESTSLRACASARGIASRASRRPRVFYAMTCSAGEDVPRGVDFLFDAHRFNVAISRAQCLAVLVHSPRLLDTDCNSLNTMALVDGACRYLELASDPTRVQDLAG